MSSYSNYDLVHDASGYISLREVNVLPIKLISETQNGYVINRIYSCLCGKGTIEEEQDYTLNDDLSDMDSEFEEINDLACSSPFLKTIKEFCINDNQER